MLRAASLLKAQAQMASRGSAPNRTRFSPEQDEVQRVTRRPDRSGFYLNQLCGFRKINPQVCFLFLKQNGPYILLSLLGKRRALISQSLCVVSPLGLVAFAVIDLWNWKLLQLPLRPTSRRQGHQGGEGSGALSEN